MLRSSSITNNNVFIFVLRGKKPAIFIRQSPAKDVGYYNKIVINIKFPTIYFIILLFYYSLFISFIYIYYLAHFGSNQILFSLTLRQLIKTLPKAQRTRGLSSSCQSHIASSNANLNRISSSES